MESKIIIFLPKYCNFSILYNISKKLKYFYIFSYFYFFIKTSTFFFNKLLNYLILKKCKNSQLFFYSFFFSWEFFFFQKYSIIGKGFKLKKFKKKSLWKFNKAHFKYLFLQNYILQKRKKKFFFLLTKSKILKKINNFIIKIYEKNIFLKKGIKFHKKALNIKKKKS